MSFFNFSKSELILICLSHFIVSISHIMPHSDTVKPIAALSSSAQKDAFKIQSKVSFDLHSKIQEYLRYIQIYSNQNVAFRIL